MGVDVSWGEEKDGMRKRRGSWTMRIERGWEQVVIAV